MEEPQEQPRQQKYFPGLGRIFKPRWTRRHSDGTVTHHESPSWWVAYSDHGKEYRMSSKSPDEAVALKLLKKCNQDLGKGKITATEDRVTFNDLATDLENDYTINGKRSLDSIKLSISHLKQTFDGDKVYRITTDRVRVYIKNRQEEGAAAASINRELSALKRMFTLAMQAGRLSTTPYIPLLKEQNSRQGFINPGEFLLLRQQLPTYLRDPVAFLYHSGWRSGEMRSLEWRDVDLAGKVIRLRPENSKNSESRLLPLSGELLAIIERATENRRLDVPFVFHRDGEPIGDFRKAWQTACVAVGRGQFLEDENDEAERKKYQGLLVHDLRRSAIRNMVRAGVHERVAMRLSGHKTRSIFDRYNIVSEADLLKASEQVQEHFQEQAKLPSVVVVVNAPRRGTVKP